MARNKKPRTIVEDIFFTLKDLGDSGVKAFKAYHSSNKIVQKIKRRWQDREKSEQ